MCDGSNLKAASGKRGEAGILNKILRDCLSMGEPGCAATADAPLLARHRPPCDGMAYWVANRRRSLSITSSY
ncbi:hypothetical protein [Pseudomonas sp. DWP3-1-2]|uniref:hypothetical protein n=1 Tax=Pseudomonas sp. DWP3-1-2 TaxID=2804645 RepID=UPI003CFB0D60